MPSLVRGAPLVVLLIALCVPAPARAQRECAVEPVFQKLDFWVGTWNVFVGDELVGTHRIEHAADGCAVIEYWRAGGAGKGSGDEGIGLFYHNAAADVWKHVWVTSRAMDAGGVKEKQLIEQSGDGSLRFQGRVFRLDGTSYLDRTTLKALIDGRVHQVVEQSEDGGRTWTITFDALYVRRGEK